MHPPISASVPAGIVANGHDLLLIAAAGVFLLLGLQQLGRAVALAAPLGRIFAAFAVVALSIGAALLLLVAVSIGGR